MGAKEEFQTNTPEPALGREPQVIGIEHHFQPLNKPVSADDVVNLILAGWMYWGTMPIVPSLQERLKGATDQPIPCHVFYRPVFGDPSLIEGEAL